IPDIGAITATSFATAIEDPGNFKTFRSVSAWIDQTTRRYQKSIMTAILSRRGDRHFRELLHERRRFFLTRSSTENTLRIWGLQLRERIGFKRAAVAV
ncbi:MAG: IS110 family transposase, partial [Mesorhizobium sp.]